MSYTNGTESLSNYHEVQALYPNTSLSRAHPENWPGGPWEIVQPEPLAPISLPDRQQQALQQINYHYQQLAEQQIGQYPDFEIQTWQDQEREAITYQAWINNGSAGSAPLAPVLSAIVTARGIELSDLVTRVIANATAWRQLVPTLAGQRQAAADQVMGAATVEQVDAVIDSMLQSPAVA